MGRRSTPILLALGVTVAAALACEEESASGPVSPPVSFSMNAVEGNGVTGTAQIDDQPGDVSTVTVTLQGLPAGGQHAGHVHRGSCANQGAILFGLMPIAADAQGNGTAFTNQVPDELLDVGFYLQYHVELEPPGDPISCADIPPREPPGIDY